MDASLVVVNETRSALGLQSPLRDMKTECSSVQSSQKLNSDRYTPFLNGRLGDLLISSVKLRYATQLSRVKQLGVGGAARRTWSKVMLL